MVPSNEERRIQELLQHTATDMPTAFDVMPRLRQQLSQRPITQAHRGLSTVIPVISITLLIVLILVGFAVFLPKQHDIGRSTSITSQTPPPATATLLPTPLPAQKSGLQCPLPKGQHYSVQVTKVYADPTKTEVKYTVTPIIHMGNNMYDGTINIGWIVDDQNQATYQDVFGSSDLHNSYGAFQPLPAGELAAPHRMTLHIFSLDFGGLLNNHPCDTYVNGSWTVPFQVMPVTGSAQTLNVAPQTQHGVTIQPLSVEIVPPAHNGIDAYYNGGARLLIKFSGLPATMSNNGLTEYATASTDANGDGYETLNSPDLGSLAVNGTKPADIEIPNGGYRYEPPQPLGANTQTIEVIFTDVAPFQSTSHLSIDKINISSPGANAPTFITGPWNFTWQNG
jgi:hypothetical protein